MTREVVFLFEQDEACAAMAVQQFTRGSNADDATADDAEFVSQIRPRSDVLSTDVMHANPKPDKTRAIRILAVLAKSGGRGQEAHAVWNAVDGDGRTGRILDG
jgi:hypothetical protein